MDGVLHSSHPVLVALDKFTLDWQDILDLDRLLDVVEEVQGDFKGEIWVCITQLGLYSEVTDVI